MAGLILYLVTLILTTYFAYSEVMSIDIWNVLLWTLILFTSVNAIAKAFVQEEDRSLYYFFTTSPVKLITSKVLYHFAYQGILSLLTLLLFMLFFSGQNLSMGFFLILFLGSLGLSSVFTFISALASKTNSPATMMAILGFPIIIPVLILSIQSTKTLLLGGGFADIQTNFLTLVSLNVIIIALTFILFPFTWKS